MSTSETIVEHLVIRASAGSGKTFQLANRFLGLAAGGTSPDQILAATFARKAAGEILERVVTRLATAADAPKAAIELARHLARPDLSSEQCGDLLRALLARLHRLQIGTLDSFFVQLATHFSLELGLPLGWRIVDTLEDTRLRGEAIRQVLKQHGTTDCARLVHLLSKGEATRSVTRQIMDIVDGLYDAFRDTTREAWYELPHPRPLEKSAVADALTQLAALPAFPDKNWIKAHTKAIEAAELEDWDTFLSAGLPAAMIAGKDVYSRKPIEAHVAAAYQPLLDHARAMLVNRLADQTESTWRMLSHFHAAYSALRADRRVLRFDDVTRALAEGLKDHGVDTLDYRLDGMVAHLLLDEFQDTSRIQWEVLLPFALRVTAGTPEHSFFCVGDAKQAIYGWRGGLAEIFDSAVNQLTGITQRSLIESFRSAPPVIDTVNEVFSDLPANKALSENYSAVAAAWHKRFEKHVTARKELAGRCRLLVAPRAEESRNQGTLTLEYAAGHIAELARNNPAASIGVLVRRNKAVARLIYELRSKHELQASEEGGNPLIDSVAVQLILSLLKLADHPGDTTARYHIAKSPLGPIVELPNFQDDAAALQLAQAIRERLLTDGYGRTIHEWTKSLAPHVDLRDLNRLLQLVEMAYRLDDGALRRPDDFIAQVESRRVEDPTAAKVRVMTVHQAKGLQFDIVVLPELDVPFKGQTPLVVADRAEPLAPIRRVCRYAGETVQALLPDEFRKMFERWPDQTVAEGLCVLYVAMTRAIHSLDMIIAPAKTNERTWPKTFAGVLRSALAPEKQAEPLQMLFEHGDSAGGEAGRPAVEASGAVGRPATAHSELDVETLDVALRPSSSHRRRGLDYQTPSGMEGGRSIHLQAVMQLDSRGGMKRGNIVHAWLEQIKWIEEGAPDDAALRRAAGPWAGPDIDLAAEIKRFRHALEQPAVREVLSREAYRSASPDIEPDILRERKFALREENAILHGAMDRLVLLSRDGLLIGADIVDFKTDAVMEPADISTRADHYRPQLDAYRRCVAKLTGLATEQITARLLFINPAVVHAV